MSASTYLTSEFDAISIIMASSASKAIALHPIIEYGCTEVESILPSVPLADRVRFLMADMIEVW